MQVYQVLTSKQHSNCYTKTKGVLELSSFRPKRSRGDPVRNSLPEKPSIVSAAKGGREEGTAGAAEPSMQGTGVSTQQ